MSYAKNQHYIPASYLNFWGDPNCNSDYKKVYCFGFQNGRFLKSELSTKSICSEKHLYSRHAANDDDKYRIENFFRDLENDSIPLIKKMKQTGTLPLSNRERSILTIFFMALQLRTPDSVQEIKTVANSRIREEFSTPEFITEYLKVASENESKNIPKTPLEYMEQYDSETLANFGLDRIPSMLLGKNNNKFQKLFTSMEWFVRDFSHCKGKLLISDNPLYRTTGLDNPNCIFGIPLSPTKVFFAVRNQRNMWNIWAQPAEELRQLINENLILQAAKWVIGQDTTEMDFIKSRFGKGYKKIKLV